MSGFPSPTGGRVPPGSGFRVTVLGRAGSFPAPGEPTTGLLLSTDTTHLLVDCGSGVLANLLKVLSPGLLTAVLITHLHPDHTSDLAVLGHLLKYGSAPGSRPGQSGTPPLSLYVPVAPVDRRSAVPIFDGDDSVNVQFFDEGQTVTVGDLRLSFRRTSHAIYCLALRAESACGSVVFTADTGPSDDVIQLASGASLIICELSMPDDMAGTAGQVGHLTPSSAARLVVEGQVPRALMTHFVMGYDADKLVLETQIIASTLARKAGRVPPVIEPAQLLKTYPVQA